MVFIKQQSNIIPIVIVMLSCMIVLTTSLKISEAGRHDWHIQNIGELSHVQSIRNKLFFFSKDLNVFGYLNLLNGSIDNRITLSERQRLLYRDDKKMTFVTQTNQIVSYSVVNLERSSNNKFMLDKTLGPIQSFLQILKKGQEDGSPQAQVALELVNDENSLRAYGEQHITTEKQGYQTQYIAEEGQVLQKLVRFTRKTYLSSIKNSNKVSLYEINNENGKLNKNSRRYVFNSTDGSSLRISQIQQIQGVDSLVIVLEIISADSSQSSSYLTLILGKNLQLVQKLQGKYDQISGTQLVFHNQIFDLATKKTTQRRYIQKSSNLNVPYWAEDTDSQLNFFKDETPYLSFRKPSANLKANKIFFIPKSDYEHYILIQYCDMKIEFHYVNSNNVARLMWERQEALAYIDKVLFMKYPFSDHLDNDYHRSLFTEQYRHKTLVQKLVAVPSDFINRVTEEIKDLIWLIQETVQSVADFGELSQIDFKDLLKFKMSESQEIKLGLKKYVVVVTEKGVVFALDTKTKQILWKRARFTKNQQIVALIKLQKDYELDAAVLASFNAEELTLQLQQISEKGEIHVLQRFSCKEKPTIHKLSPSSILIKMGDTTAKYTLGQANQEEQNQYYFYTVSEDKVTGWQQSDDEIIQIWNFHLDDEEKVLKSASAYKGNQKSLIPLMDNGKVIFKNVDFTNLAILTSKNATSMSLYILNGLTGQVHFNEFKVGLNLNHPVNMAYDENNVIVTYYNNRNKLFEIWTVQAYQERIQTQAVSMIKDYIQDYSPKPSKTRESIIFLSEVYGAPVPIKHMYISESRQSLIRRNLIIVTRDNKLYSIGRQLISTRRPKQTAFFSNEAYPPYAYLIPYDPSRFFSHRMSLNKIDKVRFSSSDMESTLFIMAYGYDIFMIRHAPDSNFDMIGEDFNYLILVVIMVAATLAVLALRYKANSARLTKPHRD